MHHQRANDRERSKRVYICRNLDRKPDPRECRTKPRRQGRTKSKQMRKESKMKEFYCAHCEADVECELETIAEGKGDAPGNCSEGYFCPMCGREFLNEPDPDRYYDEMREQEAEAQWTK